MCGMRFPGRVLDVTETPPADGAGFHRRSGRRAGAAQFAPYRQRPTNRREHVAELMGASVAAPSTPMPTVSCLALAVSLAQGTPRAERLLQP